MNKIVTNYKEIIRQIDLFTSKTDVNYCKPRLVAVSKTFPTKDIQILIDAGHKKTLKHYVLFQLYLNNPQFLL